MRIRLLFSLLFIVALTVPLAVPAAAVDMPARKPGLWEMKMQFVGRNLSQTFKSCIDAETDKMMNAFGNGMMQQVCSKQDVRKDGDSLIVDSECQVAGARTTSRSVVTGDFDSAYTAKVTSRRTGGPSVPGMPAETQMMIEAKWLGACQDGQRPGDMITANGMKINIRDMQKFMPGSR